MSVTKKTVLLVYGYIRLLKIKSNSNDVKNIASIPNEIIDIIHSFFMLIIPSQIIGITENIAFINKVSSKFNNIKKFDLLYSSLKHGLSIENYIKYTNDNQKMALGSNNTQTVNLLIIKNKNGHIFGVYREWGDNNDWNKDSFFLFVISPEMYIFDEKPGRGSCCFPTGQTIFNLYGSSIISQDFLIYEATDWLQDIVIGFKMVATTLSGCICIANIDHQKMYGNDANQMFDTNGRQVIEIEVFTSVKYQNEF